ncbi:MAG: hypothetical protein SP1CHLAM54_15860 [Chlamydiia bacterium]|nr:hypothetical protein [Chlamydiia bacterium]MCH9616475.1 hypothetical protein [Chlamydiia bacterium]MCH9629539.1 hypothetical protein [Chlamydiia bacterium]
MLEAIFGGKNVERVLFYLLMNERCYGGQLAEVFESSLSPLQKALDRLETGGVLVSTLEGRTRIYQFNPRYPFKSQLLSFLEKAYEFLPQEFKDTYYEPTLRKRPRRRGKPA